MEHLLWEHQITIKEKEIEVIMEQYIDKATVVAEIERLREEEYPCDTFEESTGYYNALDEIATFLNALEVKDVDLEKEIRLYKMRNPIIGHREESLKDYMSNVAKHFFELGLKAQKRELVITQEEMQYDFLNYQKNTFPKWSEEDDKILDKIVNSLMGAENVECADYNIMYDWLNSIEERMQ